MTGRDLIIYILENNLEDKPVFEDGKLIGFLSVEEAAVKLGVGVETILTMIDLNVIDYEIIGKEYFIPIDFITIEK